MLGNIQSSDFIFGINTQADGLLDNKKDDGHNYRNIDDHADHT